jgi:hypothetical protein
MSSRLLAFTLATVLFLSCTSKVLAAKPRVVKKGTPVVAASGYSTARLSRATNSVVVTFRNLNRAKKVTYELSYSAQGIAQGVIGSIIPTGQASDSRDLYFGTCSKSVCTPHYNITGATLTIKTQPSSGGANTKRYRIKI